MSESTQARAPSLGERVADFYLADYPIYPLALLRVGLGLIMFLQYVLYAPYMADIFGPEGVLVSVNGPSWVTSNYLLVWGLLLAGALCYTLGLFTRVAGLVAILGHVAFHHQTWTFSWGDGTVGHAFIFYTLLGDPGGRLSLDALLRRRRDPNYALPETTAAYAIRLIQLHVTAIYFMAAWNRVTRAGWRAGRMTYVALSHSVFSRFPSTDWFPYQWPLWAATWYTWIIELGAPVVLWIRRVRTPWVIGLMLMHLGLELSSTIGWWQFYMLTVLTAFLPSAWSERVVRGAERRLGLVA
ncbi:MAG: HTTM domain-containing protein [Myxococcales bacterium]|nr:HTTM domain-containing protein [Myxococcales bacterium]